MTACTLLIINIALAQDVPRSNSSANVTIVTAGDISITKAADGKTAVWINFVPGKTKSSDTRITISGPYTLDVNGGVQEVKGPQGIELHVLSHEDLRFESTEISSWEQSHKFSQYSAAARSPAFPGCAIQFAISMVIPEIKCRYNSSSELLLRGSRRRSMREAANSAQEKK